MSKVSMKVPSEFELALSYYNLLGEQYYYSLHDSCESSSNEKVDIVSPAKSNIVISMEETKKGIIIIIIHDDYNNNGGYD